VSSRQHVVTDTNTSLWQLTHLATCSPTLQATLPRPLLSLSFPLITSYNMFEVENTLRERLELTKQQRTQLKNELTLIENKLKNLFNHLPSRPKHTQQQLQEMMKATDYHHTTTPQSNEDERNFMREMDKFKKKMKEEVEYNRIQDTINELKAKKVVLYQELKEKEVCIDELYQGTRRLRVSTRLDCEPTSLIEQNISVPEDKLAHVIGRNGSAIKGIESECCVGIDVERIPTGGSQLRLIGLPGGVAIAVDKIRLILNTITDIRILSEPLLVCLLRDKAALLQQVQDRYHVRIDLSKATRECKITGLTNDVNSSVQDILSIDCLSEVMKLEANILPFLMGKGGGIIRAIQNEHDIYLDVDREKMSLTLIGLRPNVLNAKNALSEVINENKEVEDSISCERYALLEVIIGSKGTIIRQLQKEYGVGIVLEKEKVKENPKLILTAEEKLEHERVTLRGTTAKVLVAKQHLLDLLADYNLNTEYLSIPDYSIPYILGKKGSNIQKLRSQYSDVSIDVIPNMSSVRIHSPEVATRQLIKNLLLEIIQNNAQYEYQINRLLAISLKSEKSLSLRNYLSNELQMKYDIDVDNEVIKFRGNSEKFPFAITALDKFCDDNFSLENIYSEEDFASFLNSQPANSTSAATDTNTSPSPSGSAATSTDDDAAAPAVTPATGERKKKRSLESLAKKIENDYSVSLFFNKKQNSIRITGAKFSVLAADDAINHILHGDSTTGESVIVPMNSLAIGSFIGKGGKKIQEFGRKYQVMIDILRSREQVRLRGTCEAVNQATKGLLQLIDKLRLSTILTIGKNPSPEDDDEAEAATGDGEEKKENGHAQTAAPHSHSHEKLIELANNSQRYFGSDVTVQPDDRAFALQGTKKQIEYTKRYLSDQLRGISEVEIPILQHHYDHFHNSPSSMERLEQTGRNFNIEVSLGSRKAWCLEDRYVLHESVIRLHGSNHILLKAKIIIYRLLDYLFPAEFISIPMDSYFLRSLWADSLLAFELAKQFPTASVTYDHTMSCLRIVGIDSIVVHQVTNHMNYLLKSFASYEINEELFRLVMTQKTLISSQVLVVKNQSSTSSSTSSVTDPASVSLQFPSLQKLSFYLKASNEATVLEAQQKLIDIVTRIQKENWQMTVGVEVLGSLIGKGGATINKLRNETKANIELDRTSCLVKVNGKEQNVLEAKRAILQLIADREAENYQVKLAITRECIPVIIGQKGVKIREIRQVSGVISLDIDRKTEQFVLIKGR
jgi:predicted PilT family ATPase